MPKRFTYADLLERFPQETNRRIELIDGELLMPRRRASATKRWS
ncbi:MAG TPA: hypothetical protein VMP42_06130 [Actinomycetota bacterium]|nr:hypothetical protein [Actinomycetota bacterium]